MILSRRSLITGLASLLAAPAIVRASSLMPVKAWPMKMWPTGNFVGEWSEFSSESPQISIARGLILMTRENEPPYNEWKRMVTGGRWQ